MPKATVSTLEVEVWSSAVEALDALDRLEAKLNKVGDALDRVIAGAKGIKDIGNLAASFKGITSALSAVQKSQQAVAKHKNDGKVSNQDLIDRKRLLDDISKMSANRLFGIKNNAFANATSGAQLPALLPQSYRDLTKMLPAVYGGKQLPATFTPAIDASKVIDAEWREVKESVNDATGAVEEFAEKSRDATLFGTKPKRSNYRGTPTSVWGDKYLRDTAKNTSGHWYDAFRSVPGFDANIKNIGASRGMGVGNGSVGGVKAWGGTDMKKMADAAAAALDNQNRALEENANAASDASTANQQLGNSTDQTTRKVRNSHGVLRQMIGILARIGKSIGGIFGGKGHTSLLFGRRGFGGFLSLMVIRRALTSLIRALTGGIKEGSDNLAQYSSEYNNSISRMVSGLNYLKNAWAAAFAPIVNVVAPYVETFINLLASALNAIGRFMAALTGKGFAVQAKKVWTDYAASLDKAGSSASGAGSKMDDLKKTIMSFDEIHALTDPNSSGGGGGGGSGSGGLNPSDMFETVDLAGDSLAGFASQLREKILAGDWYGVGAAIAEKMNGVIVNFQNGDWGSKLATALNNAINGYRGWVDTFNFDAVGKGVAEGINKFFDDFSFSNFGAAAATTMNKLLHAFNVFASVTHWKEIGGKIMFGIETFFNNVEWSEIGTAIVNACNALLDFINGAIEEAHPEQIGLDIADAIIGGIEDFFMGEQDSPALQRIAHAIINIFRLLFPTIAGQFQDTYEHFAPGHNLYDDILQDLDNFYDDVNEHSDTGSKTVMDTVSGNVKTPYDEMCKDIVNMSGYAVDDSMKEFEVYPERFDENVVDPLKGHTKKFKDNTVNDAKEAEKGVEYQFKPLDSNLEMKTWKPIAGHANAASGNIALYMAQAAANMTSKFNGISTWFDINVKTPVSTVFSRLGTTIGNAFTSAKTNLQSGWGSVSGWFETNVKKPISDKFSSFWQIGSTAASNLRSGLKSITNMPNFHFTWGIEKKIVSLFGHQIVASVPWPKISFYAQGGFPSADLFAANEVGNPEMVGRIGNRTAVANNNQITEALKNAMIEGLMQYGMAMSANDNGQPYQINLVVKTMNDEVLARAVERGNARRNSRLYPAGAVR